MNISSYAVFLPKFLMVIFLLLLKITKSQSLLGNWYEIRILLVVPNLQALHIQMHTKDMVFPVELLIDATEVSVNATEVSVNATGV